MFSILRKIKSENSALYNYNNFLKKFLYSSKMVNVLHVQKYNRNLEDMCLINKDGIHTPGYGASSCQYIVANGINYTFPNGYGHDTIYFLDDYRIVGYSLYFYKNTYGYDYFFEQIEKNQVVYSWGFNGYNKYLVLNYNKRRGTVTHNQGISNWDNLYVNIRPNDTINKDYVGNTLILKKRNQIIDDILSD